MICTRDPSSRVGITRDTVQLHMNVHCTVGIPVLSQVSMSPCRIAEMSKRASRKQPLEHSKCARRRVCVRQLGGSAGLRLRLRCSPHEPQPPPASGSPLMTSFGVPVHRPAAKRHEECDRPARCSARRRPRVPALVALTSRSRPRAPHAPQAVKTARVAPGERL